MVARVDEYFADRRRLIEVPGRLVRASRVVQDFIHPVAEGALGLAGLLAVRRPYLHVNRGAGLVIEEALGPAAIRGLDSILGPEPHDITLDFRQYVTELGICLLFAFCA